MKTKSSLTPLVKCGLLALVFVLSACQSHSVKTRSRTSQTPAATPPAVAVRPAPVAPAPQPASTSGLDEAPAPAPAVIKSVEMDAAAIASMPYRPESTLTGLLRSIGSDSLDGLMDLWIQDFRRFHPNLTTRHEGRGSSTAIPALVETRCELGPMSRPLKKEEVDKFVEKFGYKPTQLKIAVDAIGVYVHPDNPVAKSGLTLAQLDAIFGSKRLLGGTQDIVTWGQLGLKGEYASAPIKVFSRNSASGTYGFFKDKVLKGGDFKTTNYEFRGSEQLVEAVAKDRFAIGYSGIAFAKPTVKAVSLANSAESPVIEPNEESALSEKYPLARFLYMTVNHHTEASGSVMMREFMRFVYSQEGQTLVTKEGYYTLPPRLVAEEVGKLN